ncbi:hypothetical protein [Lactobacillus crispatus]|uniref:hypothetical protein n=1 Tax=Lactobacillus crispatus TaxID=47770 RepID=UPI0018C27EBB|nr:hypothetical protein [Lactobacillus crispatus]MBG0732538.1 hypothetical protein [Lactobacillus crispatus]
MSSEISKRLNLICWSFTAILSRSGFQFTPPIDISKNDGKYLNSDVEYHYLFSPSAEGNYQWHTINRNGIKPLTQKVIDSEKESGTLADVDWNKSSFTSDWAAPLTDKEISSLNDDISLQS